jgi:hypothetical protein
MAGLLFSPQRPNRERIAATAAVPVGGTARSVVSRQFNPYPLTAAGCAARSQPIADLARRHA